MNQEFKTCVSFIGNELKAFRAQKLQDSATT